MTISTETIRKITIQGSTQGVTQATAELQKLGVAQDNLAKGGQVQATVTDLQSRRALSAAEAYRRQTLAVVEGARATDQIAKATRTADAALQQGVITQIEHAKRIDLINQKYGQASGMMNAYAKATQTLQAETQALASNLGTAGAVLGAIGPVGIAVAAVLGVVTVGISELIKSAERMGERATQMSNFAIATGFSVDQVRALTRQATLLGLSGDQVQGWLQKFAVNLDDARRGAGPLAEAMDRIDHQLLVQLEMTKTNAQAWDIFAKAADRAGLSVSEFMKVALGKGSGQAVILTQATLAAGGLDAMTASQNRFKQGTSAQIEEWKKLNNELTEAKSQVDQAFAKMFTSEVLQREIGFYQWLKKIADVLNSIKDIKIRPIGEVSFGEIKDAGTSGAGAVLTTILPDFEKLAPIMTRILQVTEAWTQSLGDAGTQAASAAVGLARIEKLDIAATTKVVTWAAWAAARVAAMTAVSGAMEASMPLSWHLAGNQIRSDVKSTGGIPAGSIGDGYGLFSNLQKWAKGEESIFGTFHNDSVNLADKLIAWLDGVRDKLNPLAISGGTGWGGAAVHVDTGLPALAPAPGLPSQGDILHTVTLDKAALAAGALKTKLLELAGVAGDTRGAEALANEWKAVSEVLGAAATPADQFKTKMLQLAAAADKVKEFPALTAAIGRAEGLATAERNLQVIQNLVSALGPLATVEDQVNAVEKKIAVDRAKLIPVSEAQAVALKNLTAAQADWARINESSAIGVFNLQGAQRAGLEELQSWIDKKLFDPKDPLQYAAALNALNEKLRGTAEQAALAATPFKQIKQYMLDAANDNKALDTIGVGAMNSIAGIATELAHAATPMDALVSAAKKLEDILIDILAKKAVASVFSGLSETGTQTAAATSAGSVWITAGQTFNASLVAAATTAAGIMSGGAAADATLKVASTTESAAVDIAATELKIGMEKAWEEIKAFAEQNWIALIVTAIASLAALVGLGGSSAQKTADRAQILGYNNRAVLANTDTNTLAGALTQFDLNAQQERANVPKTGGFLGIGQHTDYDKLRALDAALAQERLKIIRDFGAQAAAAEKQAEADRLKLIDDFSRSLNAARGQSFLNDFKDLFDNIAKYSAAGADPTQLMEFTRLASQQLVDDAGLVGDAFTNLTGIFPQLTGVVHESTKALQEQAAAQNASAKSIVDFVNQLMTGPSANVSPASRFSGSKSVFDKDYELAQGGNADAYAAITKDADNLLSAAKAMFGSSSAFQQIRTGVIDKLLSLPAVKQTTDPVTQAVRDVLVAIQLGNATQATNATLASVLTAQQIANLTLGTLLTQPQLAALGLAGNATVAGLLTAAQLAQAGLASNPTLINTNTAISTLLTQAQLQASGLAGDTTVATLLTAADLARAGLASQATLGSIDLATGQSNALQTTANTILNSSVQLQAITNAFLDSIRALQNTASAQLTLLNTQFTAHPSTIATYSGRGVSVADAASNNLLDALAKIVINTKATADNTANMQFLLPGGSSLGRTYGTLATGGVIPAGGLALVSEHSAGGGRFVRAGSEPISVFPGAPSNDNRPVVDAIDRLNARIAQLEARLAAATMEGAKVTREGFDDVLDQQRGWQKQDKRAGGQAGRG